MSQPTRDAGDQVAGVFYPSQHLVALVDDHEAAQRARAALLEGDWQAEQVTVYSGPEFQAMYRRKEEQQGLLARVASAFASDERIAQEQYLDETEDGRAVIVVAAATGADAERATAALAPFHVHAVRYYADLTITEVLPDQPVVASTEPPRDDPPPAR